jgi:hypothetical protein
MDHSLTGVGSAATGSASAVAGSPATGAASASAAVGSPTTGVGSSSGTASSAAPRAGSSSAAAGSAAPVAGGSSSTAQLVKKFAKFGLSGNLNFDVVSKLPDNAKWKEAGSVYDSAMHNVPGVDVESVHKRYDGRDRPIFKQEDGKNTIINTAKMVILVIESNDEERAIFGEVPKSKPDSKRSITTDQVPEPNKSQKQKASDSAASSAGQPSSSIIADDDTVMGDGEAAPPVEKHDQMEHAEARDEKAAAEESGDSFNLVKVSYSLHTQHPAIQFEINNSKSGADRVYCNIYPSQLDRAAGNPEKPRLGCEFYAQLNGESDDKDIRDNLPKKKDFEGSFSSDTIDRLTELCDTKSLCETRLFLDTNKKGAWSGIVGRVLEELSSIYPTDPEQTLKSLVIWLTHAKSIKIYTKYAGNAEVARPNLAKFTDYFTGCLQYCHQYGTWWYYRLAIRDEILKERKAKEAAGGDDSMEEDVNLATILLRGNYERYIDLVAPPRWLCIKWESQKQKDGSIKYEILQHGEFDIPRSYPDVETKGFLQRLALHRDAQYERQRIEAMTEVYKDKSLTATIFTHDATPSTYVFHIKTPKAEDPGEHIIPTPEVGTTVELAIVTGDDGKDKTFFYGEVVTDELERGGDFVAAVSGPPGFPCSDEAPVPIQLKFKGDPTSIRRRLNAVHGLEKGQDRKDTGPDFPQIVLGADRTVKDVGFLCKDMSANEKSTYSVTIKKHNLNKYQRDAANDLTAIGSDCTGIWGPAGAGKTATSMAATHALIKATKGRPVDKRYRAMVTGPSHKSVDEAMSKMINYIDQHSSVDIKICRFKGAYYKVPGAPKNVKKFDKPKDDKAKKDDNPKDDNPKDDNPKKVDKGKSKNKGKAKAKAKAKTQPEESDEAKTRDEMNRISREVSFFRLVRERLGDSHAQHKDYAYHVIKARDIDRWAAMAPGLDPSGGRAALYKEMETKIANREVMDAMDFDDAREYFLQWIDLSAELDKVVMSTIDIIFCTCNASCHDVLAEMYNFTLLVVEEAGQGNCSDIATPMEAHKEKIRALLVNGDHTQCRPTCSSKGRNEGERQLGTSFFYTLVTDTLKGFPIVKLKIQYRMHPDIAKLAGRVFYPDHDAASKTLLQNHPSVETPTPLDAIFEDFMTKKFGAAYPVKSHVVAIDTSSTHSERFENTTSWHNEDEGKKLLDFLNALIEYVHATTREHLDLRRVGILAAHTGQKRFIQQILSNTFDKDTGRSLYDLWAVEGGLTIASISEVQGGEFDVVLVTHTMNRSFKEDPRGPMAIGFVFEEGQLCVEITRARRALVLFGNFKGWCKSIDPVNRGTKPWDTMMLRTRQDFRSIITYIKDEIHVLSEDDWNKAIKNNVVPTAPTFKAILENTPAYSSGKNTKHGKTASAGKSTQSTPRFWGHLKSKTKLYDRDALDFLKRTENFDWAQDAQDAEDGIGQDEPVHIPGTQSGPVPITPAESKQGKKAGKRKWKFCSSCKMMASHTAETCPTCDNCGQKGHVFDKCKDPLKCSRCKGLGHVHTKCTVPIPGPPEGNTPAQGSA